MLSGTTAMLVAHTLTRAGECRRHSVGWTWPGRWSAQDWKNSARSEVALARRLRLNDQAPIGATHTYVQRNGKITYAKSYKADGMRFRARLWSLTDKCWGGSSKIYIKRLTPI